MNLTLEDSVVLRVAQFGCLSFESGSLSYVELVPLANHLTDRSEPVETQPLNYSLFWSHKQFPFGNELKRKEKRDSARAACRSRYNLASD